MRACKRWAAILSANLVLFLLVFVLLEGSFRIIGIPYNVKYIPNENSFARFDPDLGWSYVPHKSAIHKTGDRAVPVYFDENGIRVPASDYRLDYSRPSILFIGGSFTMGHGLSFEDSFVGRFGALSHDSIQVVNLGVQGFGSDQALLTLKRYINRFNTKAVVYTFIEDHIARNGSYDRRMLVPSARFLGTKPKFTLDDHNELYLARKAVLYEDYTNSYLIDFLKMRVGALAGTFPPYQSELTRAIIMEMKKCTNEHNARFVVLNWKWTRDNDDNIFKGLDVDVIDTLDGAPDGWEKMVLFGGIHPDRQAGEHAARLLYDYFYENGFMLNSKAAYAR